MTSDSVQQLVAGCSLGRHNFVAQSGLDSPARQEMLASILAKIDAEKLEVVRGSGNVFRDLGHKNADAEQFKAILAAEVVKVLDRERLTVRAAQARTGIAAADFSRIRNADLGRFTMDRLMSVLNRLGSRVEVKIRVHRAASSVQGVRAGA